MKQFGKLQILLSQTRVRLMGMECEAEWRMGRDWYTLMSVEEWEMVAFRTDTGDLVTHSVSALD